MNTQGLSPAQQSVIDYLIEHDEISEFDRMVIADNRVMRALINRGICEENELGGGLIFSPEAAAHYKPVSAAADESAGLNEFFKPTRPVSPELTPPMDHAHVDGVDMFTLKPAPTCTPQIAATTALALPPVSGDDMITIIELTGDSLETTYWCDCLGSLSDTLEWVVGDRTEWDGDTIGLTFKLEFKLIKRSQWNGAIAENDEQ